MDALSREPQILRWEEPPPMTPQSRASRAVWAGRPGRWNAVVVELQLKPGEWAVVHEGPTRSRAAYIAWTIRSGALIGFTAGEFEAEARAGDGGYTVYVRYVGGDDA